MFSAQYEKLPHIGFPEYRIPEIKKGDICPKCGENERGFTASGKQRSYCTACEVARNREIRQRAKASHARLR